MHRENETFIITTRLLAYTPEKDRVRIPSRTNALTIPYLCAPSVAVVEIYMKNCRKGAWASSASLNRKSWGWRLTTAPPEHLIIARKPYYREGHAEFLYQIGFKSEFFAEAYIR